MQLLTEEEGVLATPARPGAIEHIIAKKAKPGLTLTPVFAEKTRGFCEPSIRPASSGAVSAFPYPGGVPLGDAIENAACRRCARRPAVPGCEKGRTGLPLTSR